MNQNWSGSSFPKSLNKGSFNEFSMLNCGGGGGGMGEVAGYGCEIGDGVGGGGSRRNPYLINQIALHGEVYTTPYSSSNGGEINGLYSRPFLPSFLQVFPLRVAANIKVAT